MSVSLVYDRIYNDIVNTPCTSVDIGNLKCLFETQINSKRRLESIRTLRELLLVLEKRDCLGPDNVEPLRVIAIMLGRESLFDLYNPISVPITPVLPEIPRDPKSRAYRLIATDIGKKWQDFARALGLPEGEIDNLSNAHCNTADRVHKILRFHEGNCDRRQWLTILLEALREARRSDLSRRVQTIFDTS